MARTVQQIYNQILAQKNAEAGLAGLNSPSNVAIYRLWMWLTAVSQAFLEQVLDLYKADIQNQIAKPGIGTLPWFRDRILEFQTGYNLVYSNGILGYTTIDKSARIVSRCSVSQSPDKVVLIKVATLEPPQKFTDLQLDEISFYCSTFQFAGTEVAFISKTPDQLYVKANIHFNGQLDPLEIRTNVVNAMNKYCQELSSEKNFNGAVILNAIQDALQNAPGVKYITLHEVAIRSENINFENRLRLFSLADGISQPISETVSGYLIGDNDPGHTFNDSFTYVPV